MNKSTLRKIMQNKRNDLTRKEIQLKSQKLFQQLYRLPLYQDSSCIMSYVSIGQEVFTHEFIIQALKEGKKIIVPVTKPDTRELLLSQVLHFKEDLTIGHWGLLEPKKEAMRPVPSSELDLILVPGLAFTMDGFRLGYGGGYYDRFLSTLEKKPPTIGLSFELQLVDEFPVEDFDIPVDFILTEKRLIEARKYDYNPME